MLVFNREQDNVFKRRGLGARTLRVDDSVKVSSKIDVEFDKENNEIVIKEGKDKSTYILAKEIAPYGDVKNEVEVIFCNDVMLVKIIKGQFIVKNPTNDEELMLVYGGIKESETVGCDVDALRWVSVKDLESNCGEYGYLYKQYTHDFTYRLLLSSSSATHLRLAPVKNKDNEKLFFDISFGAIESVVHRRNEKFKATI